MSEGEIITSEIEQMLRSYETEYVKSVGYNGNEMLQWLGNILIALFMVIVLFLAILYCNSRIFGEYNKYLYLLLVFSLAAGAAALAARYSPAKESDRPVFWSCSANSVSSDNEYPSLECFPVYFCIITRFRRKRNTWGKFCICNTRKSGLRIESAFRILGIIPRSYTSRCLR